jgi:hypothetical protein
MIKIAPRLDPRIYILKSCCSKDENIPLSQSNWKWGWSYPQIAMHAYSPCGLIVNKPWVSNSQQWFSCSHCAHIITKGSHMLSIVDTWGRIEHFFKSCFTIVTIGFCSVSLTRMHWHPVLQKIKQSYTKNFDALVFINQAGQSFSQQATSHKKLETQEGVCYMAPIWFHLFYIRLLLLRLFWYCHVCRLLNVFSP